MAKFVETLRGLVVSQAKSSDYLAQIAAGSDNQQRLLNEKLQALIAGIDNQSRLLNEKLQALIAGIDNQSRLLNERLESVTKGMDYQSQLLNHKFDILVAGIDNQTRLLNHKFDILFAALGGDVGPAPAPEVAAAAEPAGFQKSPVSVPVATESAASFQEAMQRIPLLLDEKTYNTSHPDYDATAVRNFPGRILNAAKPCANVVYAELRKLAVGDEIPDSAWKQVLADALGEARSVPHAEQVFERRAFIEQYTAELNRKHGAHYAAGWVNLDDALFLYWLVRHLKPRTIVQTGVCNGLSSAFMMLALAMNGPNGTLHAIDLPPVFNPIDPGWTIRGKVYGVVIPEGRSSGWIIPDAYRDRFDIWNGDAKLLMPRMVEKVDSINLFYHDSDHSYNHMMFEFREAKHKLNPGGLIVADDISWNASVWDFADENGVPSYNFKGAVGVAFF